MYGSIYDTSVLYMGTGGKWSVLYVDYSLPVETVW